MGYFVVCFLNASINGVAKTTMAFPFYNLYFGVEGETSKYAKRHLRNKYLYYMCQILFNIFCRSKVKVGQNVLCGKPGAYYDYVYN